VRPQQPAGKAVGVADRVAEREAGGLAGLLQLAAEIEEAGMVFRNLVEAGGIDDRLAIDDGSAGGAERQADPGIALVPLAVFLGEKLPAAILLAEIVGDVGELNQLIDVDVWRVGEAHN